MNKTLITLPDAELIPLWYDEEKQSLFRPYGWQVLDFSKLDWDKPFKDFSKKKNKNFQRPAPNDYGVRGGKSLVIIDVDTKEDPDETLRQLVDMGLDINTFTVKTKSGGYHLYYTKPNYDVKTCTAYLFDNVDIRGADGYVVGPDSSLDPLDWEKGKYVVINRTTPIECSIKLPVKGVKTSVDTSKLPHISSMESARTDEIVEGELIPYGRRDQEILRLSGKYVAENLTDNQIKDKFESLRFESVEGDNPTLEDLMEKVDRDRSKKDDIMSYTLDRFVYVESESKIYDRISGAYNIIANMELNFPSEIMVSSGNGVRAVKVLREWIKHPDRVVAWNIGFRPSEDITYIGMDGKIYLNTYEPSLIKCWDNPVKWDDEDLSEYNAMISNLCNNDEHTIHLFNSQRAAKVQDLLWTPHWGFILISEKYRIGKDFSMNIFARLLGPGTTYAKEATITEIKEEKNQYLQDAMTVVINEPDGLRDNFTSNAIMENIKKLFSETLVTIRLHYKHRTALQETYRIPEIHSNHVDAIKLHESNKRFAAIYCRNDALSSEIYERLGNKVDRDTTNKFLRKLKRFYMDYEISKEINAARAPTMSDEELIINESRGEDVMEFCQMVKDSPILFSSDIQTDQSMVLAISVHMGINDLMAKRLWRKLKREGTEVKKLNRAMGMPIIEYDRENISGEEQRVCKIKTLTNAGKATMCQTYAIRNYKTHDGGKTIPGYIIGNFFNVGEE